jgi:hypothetical protein
MAVRLPALSEDQDLLPERFFGTHFYLGLSKPQAIVWQGVLDKLRKFNDLIGTGTRTLLAFNIALQVTSLPKLNKAVCD